MTIVVKRTNPGPQYHGDNGADTTPIWSFGLYPRDRSMYQQPYKETECLDPTLCLPHPKLHRIYISEVTV